ncbi:saccharopine dehydrogenase C-terminal domain-containing protein [Streptomyces sp. NPDC001985]|uniref:saccharopine dehydrogenase C-terminal domain-containing protein n=1 Tax=Streptomyces sp. NPDC001985 TaxID=3154406 RepID=UPI00331E1D51
MAELTTPTGRVHWIGTGLSTGSGLGLVCESAPTVLWGRTVAKAEDCLARLGLTGRATARAYDLGALAGRLAAGDVVVSMLPATEHPALAELALERRAHFVCSSYTSPAIAALAPAAGASGSVLLTEIGLDPGIDHLLAHQLVGTARRLTGEEPATVDFTSYCGSNPAVPNDFRYRFSWAPRGVLTALLTPARLIGGGAERSVPRPWEAVTSERVGGETFEVYPNRDSLPFVGVYGIPPAWRLETFVRGTLRLDGWSDAWKPVFARLADATDTQITELARELAADHPTTAADHDRVVMSVRLRVRGQAGGTWSGEYVLDATGDAAESATTRLVSTPLACGVLDVAAGGLEPGLHRATDDPQRVERWLEFLRRHAVTIAYHESGAA